jgi:hypothetical protein
MKWLIYSFFAFCQLASTEVWALSDHKITDNLVTDLQCQRLTEASIFNAIDPKNFSTEKHIPLTNWAFRYNGYELANCWSLSHSQRLLFYLGRLNTEPPNDIIPILDLIRGSHPEYKSVGDTPPQWHEQNLFSYSMINLDSLVFASSQLWQKLLNGTWQSSGSASLARHFRSEIEHYQVMRFHRPDNIRMIVMPRARSARVNQRTALEIITAIEQKKFPLINLRFRRTYQHIVLVKSYVTVGEEIHYSVYDSNSPHIDQTLIYDKSLRQFFSRTITELHMELHRDLRLDPSPETVSTQKSNREPNPFVELNTTNSAPIGVFVVDQSEFKNIGRTLLKYYQQKCN